MSLNFEIISLIVILLDLLSSLELIIISILLIFFSHLLLMLFRDSLYIKAFKKFKDPESISLSDLKDLPLVNIIMPAWNEGELFKQALDSINRLEYPKIKVIINAGGSEQTINIANSFKKYENFIVLHQEKGKGKINAINACLSHVSEGVIYTIDADVYLTDEILLRLIYPITNLNEDVSIAGHRPLKIQENKDFVKYLHINHNYSFRLKFERYVKDAISGTNTIMSLKAIKTIGKFKEDKLIATDKSRGFDLMEAGFNVYSSNDYRCLIYSDVPDTVLEFSKQRIRWVENSLLYASKTKDRLQLLKFFGLFLSSLYLLLSPFLLIAHFTLILFGFYFLLSKYVKRIRRILFFKITRKNQVKIKLTCLFYLKIIYYIYIEAIVNVYILIDYLFFKKNFKKRRNLT